MPEFTKLQKKDGTWDNLIEDWTQQCQQLEEEFDNFGTATLPVLEDLAKNPEQNAGVFGYLQDARFASVCQANCVRFLPGYDGPVLRIRHLIVSPEYDFGQHDLDDYIRLLVKILVATLNLSENELQAKHIKIHLRSPADRTFFSAFGSQLDKADDFESVQTKGSWLYITKN